MNFKDLTGRTFGYWTVLSYAGSRRWNCKCVCGKEKAVLTVSLKSGSSLSCGCKSKPKNLGDLVGKKFNMLTVESYDGHSKWKCKCDCGNYTSVGIGDLKREKVKSCGCYKHDVSSKIISEYSMWTGQQTKIRLRCIFIPF